MAIWERQNKSRRKLHKKVRIQKNAMLLTNDSPFAVKEAYVKLRTNLLFSMCANGERPCRVFAVTSPNPSEGKSLNAANIAVSFAMLGKKTLLIDADMRKPTQHKKWKIQQTKGLSDLLAKIDVCPVYQVKDIPLSIICAGHVPPNPSELLSSVNMKTIIDGAMKEFDYVVIDTPPINTVADAQILMRIVDGAVLVVRAASTKRPDVIHALGLIEQAGGNLCGVVLNDINPKTGKKDYAYNYEYEYISQE